MTVSRDLLALIKPFLKRKEYLAILGPRQAGKTTFLEILKRHILAEAAPAKPTIQMITFEDRRLLAQFEKDPVALVRSYLGDTPGRGPRYLLIDEFQYAASGGQKLKLIYDTVPGIKVIITGSSSLEIKAAVGKYMVGRILTFFLAPFNFGEFLAGTHKRLAGIYQERHPRLADWLNLKKSTRFPEGKDTFNEELNPAYESYCLWGGYPAVVLSSREDERRKVLGDIYNNYLLKDIKSLLELATERELMSLSQILAAQIGNVVVYQNLGQSAGLDHRQLKKHLRILEETYICREVRPFFRNRQKELSKNPKYYFWDMGFRNNVTENFGGLEKRPDAGAMVENAVYLHLQALGAAAGKINFWRTKAGAEVDFIRHHESQVIPVEVKYQAFSAPKITKSLASFIDAFQPERALVLTKDYWGNMARHKTQIRFAPAYYM